MTDKQFAKKLQTILDKAYEATKRRLARLEEIRAGKRDAYTTKVKGHYIKRHWVSAHDRYVSRRHEES